MLALGPYSNEKKSSRDKANIDYHKENRGLPSTAKHTSAEIVKNSPVSPLHHAQMGCIILGGSTRWFRYVTMLKFGSKILDRRSRPTNCRKYMHDIWVPCTTVFCYVLRLWSYDVYTKFRVSANISKYYTFVFGIISSIISINQAIPNTISGLLDYK